MKKYTRVFVGGNWKMATDGIRAHLEASEEPGRDKIVAESLDFIMSEGEAMVKVYSSRALREALVDIGNIYTTGEGTVVLKLNPGKTLALSVLSLYDFEKHKGVRSRAYGRPCYVVANFCYLLDALDHVSFCKDGVLILQFSLKGFPLITFIPETHNRLACVLGYGWYGGNSRDITSSSEIRNLLSE